MNIFLAGKKYIETVITTFTVADVVAHYDIHSNVGRITCAQRHIYAFYPKIVKHHIRNTAFSTEESPGIISQVTPYGPSETITEANPKELTELLNEVRNSGPCEPYKLSYI
jgi:hypothetical protein